MQIFTNDQGRSFRLLDIPALEAGIGKPMGQNIRHVRRLQKMTQNQLAAVMDMSVSQLKKYERGDELPRIHHACRLSILTGMAPMYLLKNTPYEQFFPAFFFDDDVLHCANAIMHTSSEQIGMVLALIGNESEPTYRDPSVLDRSQIPEMLAHLENQYYTDLSRNMRPWREAADLSKEQMAMLLNLSLSTIHDYERPSEQRKFSLMIAARFGAATGDDPADMVNNSRYESYRKIQLSRLARCYKVLQNVSPEQRLATIAWLDKWRDMHVEDSEHQLTEIV